MQNDKRTLAALALMTLFLYVWFEYFVPKPVPPAAPTPAPTASGSAVASQAQPMPSASPVAAAPGIPIQRIEKKSDLWDVTWAYPPAAPEQILLRKYFVALKKGSPNVKMVPFGDEAPLPFRWSFDVAGRTIDDGSVPFVIEQESDTGIEFSARLSDSLELHKRFEWRPDSYRMEHIVRLVNRSGSPVRITPRTHLAVSITAPEPVPFYRRMSQPANPTQAVAYIQEKAYRWTPVAGKAHVIPPGTISWAGFDVRHFFLGAIPVEGRWAELTLEQKEDPQSPSGGAPRVTGMEMDFVYAPLDLAAGASESVRLALFAGPKDIGILKASGPALERAIDLGDWLGPIARPILHFLRGLHSWIPNYGVAIIILTILVRLLLFPLTQMQSKSMRKMQFHKPEMDALKEKYKDDKEGYSRALMTYMKTHRINPMGGCLLLLPQLPVLFALYRVLFHSIELRHAPFFLWIHDLSAHDPYFVLPLVLGGAMFLQQKMTPSPGMDPSQASAMKIMPVMFTGLMLFLPAGLNLYILVSTLWGVAQQAWFQRSSANPLSSSSGGK